MKYLLIFLLPLQLLAQVATIKLADNTFINNAPGGRSWIDYNVAGVAIQESKDTLLIDDSDQGKITYYGDWRISTSGVFGPTENACNCSWSNSPNDSLVFRITNATRFEWYGEQMSHHGKVEAWWDDVYQGIIDTYSPDNRRVTLNWYKDNLDPEKVYKFKLVATGEKNPLSIGPYIVIQYFMVIKQLIPPIDPPIDIPDIECDTIYIHDTIYINNTIKEYYLLQPKFNYDTLKL